MYATYPTFIKPKHQQYSMVKSTLFITLCMSMLLSSLVQAIPAGNDICSCQDADNTAQCCPSSENSADSSNECVLDVRLQKLVFQTCCTLNNDVASCKDEDKNQVCVRLFRYTDNILNMDNISSLSFSQHNQYDIPLLAYFINSLFCI